MITRKSNSERHIDEQMSQFLICRVYFPIALILSQACYRVNSPNQISSFSLNHMSFRKIHRWIITWTRMYHLWNYLIFRVTNRVSPLWYWNGANLLSLTLTENMADGFVLLEPVSLGAVQSTILLYNLLGSMWQFAISRLCYWLESDNSFCQWFRAMVFFSFPDQRKR